MEVDRGAKEKHGQERCYGGVTAVFENFLKSNIRGG